MKKHLHTILLAVVAVCCVALFAPVQAMASDDAARLAPEAFGAMQRPAALFDHDAHNEKAQLEDKCYMCHHMDGSKPTPDETSEGTPCADCHAVTPEKGKTGLMEAYHKQCKSCHTTEAKGPVACGECHKR
ncbi:MAG: acidic tetraheme cytochrome c3 TmcA [Desulfovibrionaceae bacterium]